MASSPKVKKRKVFYIEGFDPRGASYYYSLYKKNLSAYAATDNKDVTISNRQKVNEIEHHWTIHNNSEDVETSYSYMVWDDLVREAWIKKPTDLAWATLKTYGRYILHYEWEKMLRLPLKPLTTIFFPLIMLLCIALIALLVGQFAGLLGSVIAIAGCIYLFRNIKSIWLLRVFVFNTVIAHDDQHPIYDRAGQIAEAIHASHEGYDEVMVVAHSNGAIISILVFNRLIEMYGVDFMQKINFTTLGGFIPLISMYSPAEKFRAALMNVSTAQFDWLDVTAPADGACYPLTHPFQEITIHYEPRVHMVSARFHTMFPDEVAYNKLRGNKFEYHFQYLTQHPLIGPYNYFVLTASALPFKDFIERVKTKNVR